MLNEYLKADYGELVTAPVALLLAIALSDLIRRWVEDPFAAVRRRLSAVPTATTHLAESAEPEVASAR